MKIEKESSLRGTFPPPLFVLALSLIGFGLHWRKPLPFQGNYRDYWFIAGILLIVVSGLMAFLANRMMRTRKTPISFSKPTVLIIRNGPFGFTRNPLYLSLAMLFAGVGVMANSFWFAPLFIVLISFLHVVILREEKYLEQIFGNDYLIYKKTVRRWL